MSACSVLGPDGSVLVARADTAAGFLGRAVGLMGRRALGPGRALYIAPCGSIHTFFMRFALDLIFVDAAHRVVRVVRDVRPWRIATGGPGATGVFELEAGWLPDGSPKSGEVLQIRPSSGTSPDSRRLGL